MGMCSAFGVARMLLRYIEYGLMWRFDVLLLYCAGGRRHGVAGVAAGCHCVDASVLHVVCPKAAVICLLEIQLFSRMSQQSVQQQWTHQGLAAFS